MNHFMGREAEIQENICLRVSTCSVTWEAMSLAKTQQGCVGDKAGCAWMLE